MLKLNEDLGKLILRIFCGGLMIFHGIHKINHGHDFIKKMLTNSGMPEFMWIGIPFSEILAPVLIIVGIFTRLSALLISFTMLMAMYLVRGWTAFQLNPDLGYINAELELLYFSMGIVIFLIGSGKYSLSNIVFTKNSKLINY
jgi:putative oxidoreductase